MTKPPIVAPSGRSVCFSRAILRQPAASVSAGLRAQNGPDPNLEQFLAQHRAYVDALRAAGVTPTILPALPDFPDSVFVEDTALCVADVAIILRPSAPTRCGEVATIRPALQTAFETVIELPGPGFVDGGDILVSDQEAMIGLSQRTDARGIDTLASILADLGIASRAVETPPQILHFKTECGLLDPGTVLATPQLAATGCFKAYDIIETAPFEEAAANIIRVNDKVFISDGYPQTAARLQEAGYDVAILSTSEAAKIDGGLSCMSLRF